MVLFTSPSLPSQAYPSSVLTDLKSQHLTAQDNVVILSSDSQSVLVHAFLLHNVSKLLSNLLEFSSLPCEPAVLILPPSTPTTLESLVKLLYSGNISGLNQTQTDQVILLAKLMGIEITVETDLSEDDGDDRSVIFSGNVEQSFFPWDEDSDFDFGSTDSSQSKADSDNFKNQLKIETEIRTKTNRKQFVLSFPKSRLNRDLANVELKENMSGFNGRIQRDYNHHPVGQYVGPYDQNENLDLSLQLPNSNLNFSKYTEFQHEGDQCYNYYLKAYKQYDALEKVDAYSIASEIKDKEDENCSNSDESESEKYFYTCQLESCQIPCPCPQCHQGQAQCPEHKMGHSALFDEKEHAVSIRSSEDFCQEKGFFTKSYILKYSGIPLKCRRCRKDLLYHESYHIKYHNNCRFCKQTWFKYKAKNKADLKSLEKREEEYFKTVCPHCDKSFCEAYFAKRHIQSEHNTSLFNCNICEREFQSKIALTYHKNLMHTTDYTRVSCDMCNKTFASLNTLKSHQKYAHSNEKNEQCTYCDKKFKQKRDLRFHLAKIHDVDLFTEKYGESYEKAAFKCGKCESTFGYKKNLNAHIRSKHSISVESFKCDKCKSEFRYRKTLVDHVKRKHGTDQPKFECNVCRKTFLQKKVLVKHQLSHNS